MVKVGECGVSCQLSGVSRAVPVYCSTYLEGDLVLSLAGLLQHRKVLLFTGSLGNQNISVVVQAVNL